MKKFMALWAAVRRFKALLSVGFLTFIPILNVIATWCYAENKVDQSQYLLRLMRENLKVGLPAFNRKTRAIWATMLAEILIVLAFTYMSVTVNTYFGGHWTNSFDWVTEWNFFHWYEIAAWCGALFFISRSLVRKLNAIYTAHRELDPDYMDEPDPAYLAKRNKAIAERAAEAMGASPAEHATGGRPA